MAPDPERLAQLAAGLSVPTIRRHIFLCADQTKPKCCAKEAGIEAWDYLKRRLAELGVLDRVYRTKANCLRICEGGPIAVGISRGSLVSLGHARSPGAIIQDHLIGGEVVEEYAFARSGSQLRVRQRQRQLLL